MKDYDFTPDFDLGAQNYKFLPKLY